jgi:beta-galactosidase
LFLNGKSLGRKIKKAGVDFRLVWDSVVYQPGELKVVAYKNGKQWATDVVKTTGEMAKLSLSADHSVIKAGKDDLCFITVKVTDNEGLQVPRSNPIIHFSIEGDGEIVATDNGDATSFVPFQSHDRPAYNGMALVIIKAKPNAKGMITLRASSENLKTAGLEIGIQ